MSDFRLPPLNLGERFYRALLRLYPPRFRQTFGLDLVETFRDQRREARKVGTPASAFWITTLEDVLVHAPAEWSTTIWRAARVMDQSQREESLMAAIAYALRIAELRFALRRLRRAPSFTIATALVLSLGIGATTAVFSIVNGVLLRPLPYPHSERLVSLRHSLEVSGARDVDQSDASVLYYQEHARAFEGIGAARYVDVNVGASSATERPERASAAQTSANLFDVLGVHALLGRTFRTGEDRIGAAPVALLSYALWQRRYRGDPAVVGRRMIADGVSREIVGVMPRDFAYPSPTVELWIPIAFDPPHAQAGSFGYFGIGRLHDGVTIDAARADLARVLPHLLDEFPSGIPPAMWAQAHVEPTVESLRDATVGDVAGMLWILLASVSLVLIIACANVANLFLVRSESRQLELAVRGALGSGVAGLIAQSLSEAAVLSIAGGLIGVMFAAIGVKLAATVGGTLGLPRLNELGIDGRVLLFALGASLFCAIVVSVVPLVRARRVPIAMVLRGGGRGLTAGRRQATRNALVIGQTALALVLVAASGLLARSFVGLERVQPGFDAEGVVVTRLTLPEAAYGSSASKLRFYDALLEKTRAIPGVQAATLSDWVPLSNDHNDTVIGIEDHPLPPNTVPDDHFIAAVDGQYFRTMKVPLLSGRTFGSQNLERPAYEAIVSRAFAARYWKDANPIGKRINRGVRGPWYTIVGEAADVHFDALDKPASEAVYFPMVSGAIDPRDSLSQFVPPYFSLLVRSTLPAERVTAAVRGIVRSLDPSLPTYGEQPLASLVRAASARAREMLLLLAIASLIALLLGAVGIYGVMAYGVSLRQREIGVRIALGAQPAQVRRMISRAGLGLAIAGVAIGVVVAVGVTRFLQSLLFGVSPTDPVTLVATCAVLLLVAFAASWIPARRAAAVDPVEAMRA